MKELEITKGEVEQNGNNGIHLKNGSCVALTHNGENKKADAELIADAFNTANKCNLLPSELLKQRDELLRVLKMLATATLDEGQKRWIENAINQTK